MSTAPALGKCCYGLLMYSRKHYDAGHEPVRAALVASASLCLQVAANRNSFPMLQRSASAGQSFVPQSCMGVKVSSDQMNPPRGEQGEAWGNFRYSCLGYSVYRATRGHKDGGVDLPSCEFGVEARPSAVTVCLSFVPLRFLLRDSFASHKTLGARRSSLLPRVKTTGRTGLHRTHGQGWRSRAEARHLPKSQETRSPTAGSNGISFSADTQHLHLQPPTRRRAAREGAVASSEARPVAFRSADLRGTGRLPSEVRTHHRPVQLDAQIASFLEARPVWTSAQTLVLPPAHRWFNVSKKMVAKMGQNLEYSRKAVANALTGKWDDTPRGGKRS